MGALIDCAGKSAEALFRTLLGSIAYVIIYILLGIIYRCMKAAILTDARYHLKNDVFTGIMNRKIADFDADNSAEYINELSNNMNMFETIYFENIILALELSVSFLSGAIVCIAIQPVMLVLMLILAFITMGVTKLTTKPLERSTEKFAESFGEYMAEIKDDFGGFRLVHSFGILPWILEKHRRKNKEAEEAKRNNTNNQTICAYVGNFVGLLSTVLVMAMAAWFSLNGMFSAGMIIAFGHLIGDIVSPVTVIPSLVANFRASKPLQERYKKLLAQTEEKGTKNISELRNAIALRELSFGYQEEKKVLCHVSATFEMGKRYAVVGSSGSGKSTLLALLLGYYPGYNGEICFDGIELRMLKRNCMEEMIGVVSQDTFLFNDTIQNNITLYKDGYTLQEIDEAIRRAGLKELVDSLPDGILTVICENGKNFSGGEKQRFSLARTLLRKSKILLLDEFTANLDEQTAREIEENLITRKDCLIITVTHRLNPQILRLYDEILVLAQGGIAETGTYDELMAADGYLKKMKNEV